MVYKSGPRALRCPVVTSAEADATRSQGTESASGEGGSAAVFTLPEFRGALSTVVRFEGGNPLAELYRPGNVYIECCVV